MKIYIAGKITGDPDYIRKFQCMEMEVKACGDTPLNPANHPEGLRQGDYMRLCFAMIDIADAVVLLSDWKESQGARLEKAYCDYVGKMCMPASEYDRIRGELGNGRKALS